MCDALQRCTALQAKISYRKQDKLCYCQDLSGSHHGDKYCCYIFN